MITRAQAQDIEVGPIRVDSGNHWTDFFTVLVLIVAASVAFIVIKRMTK